MAGNLEGEIVSDDVKFGFQRPEMYELKLKGTASVYDRHVFLCYKSHEVWPSHLESSDSDPLPKLFAATLKARKDDIKLKTILTICEVREDIGLSDGDVLIFPDMIKYRNLKESDVDAFVEDVLVSGKPWTSGPQEPINGSYVFVCSHNNRDRRCGVCGPILIEEFSKAIESKDLKNEVHVAACSHVGGHKYAGNVIIYSTDKQGKIAGHWYGYVTPDEVPILLDEHIGEGKILERLWRGQMGLHAETTDKVNELSVLSGPTVDNKGNAPVETASQGCCQGAAGFSCCRDVNVEGKEVEKGQGRLPSCFRKWDKPEVYTAIGVVGAVAVVAVAYGFYKSR
ncbi:hypothetical protein EJD97_015090 [Solanum chilense]|uniref:Uncharacterized protein n=1 Tax=Solanum chilense TaxID=4083 RepID=A0A6N2BA31_SOLCI|nr:hypothetical protein EJD97_015090 [Solanum chilense]